MKKINTALCSFGMSGVVFHAPFIHVNENFNLYGVLERSKNLCQKKYSDVKTFRTLEVLLNDSNIELVIVNTPNITHFDFTKKAILAGKHVIVEKPFTASVKQATELIELAKENNVMLSVYHNRRYDSDFLTVKNVLDKKLLGTIVEAEFHYDRYTPELSYKAHKESPTEAVGSLFDLGSHLIDQSIQLFGMPLAVSGDLDTYRPNSKVVDYFDVKLFYKSHRVVLKSTYFAREPIPGNIIHGRKGSFIKSKADVQEINLMAGKLPNTINWGEESTNEKGFLHTEKDGKIIKEHITSLKGNYMIYYDAIFNAIRFNKTVPITGYEGLNVIKIIEAILKSNHLNKKVTL